MMKYVNEAFEKLEAATTAQSVEKILDELNIHKKYRIADETYPAIRFKISKHEIEGLIEKGLINKKTNFIADVSNEDAITKLLFAVLWKNGDLKKIKHIIDGILSENDELNDNGIVFNQFGKYLSQASGQPLIDQHVIRAFGIYKALKENDQDKIIYFKRLSIISKKEKGVIKDYKEWIRNDLTKELRNDSSYTHYVDKVLFAIGKRAKQKDGTDVNSDVNTHG